jgi:AcrR family transcriptional regulator
MTRKLTSQGLERKQQLLDEAARLFADRGYADTRVVDICRAAGVAKGLFYWYFENKEALFRELAEVIRTRLRRHQAEAMDPAADPLVRIGQGAAASVRFMSENAPFFALLEVENVDRPLADVVRAGTEVHVADVRALIVAGQRLGLVREDDAELLARGVVGLVGLYGHFHRSGRVADDVDTLAAFVTRLVLRALAADDHLATAAERQLAGPLQVR